MSGTDNSDPFNSLFADALKAVEKVEKTKISPDSNEDEYQNMGELEVDIEGLEIEIDDLEIDFEISEPTTPNNDDLQLLKEEMSALERQYEQFRSYISIFK